MAAPGLYDTSVYGTALYDSFTVGGPTVELFLNSVWVDVTAYVRVENGILIQRGRSDWQAQPQAATCQLTLDNADGRFSPRYTSGAYYPYLMKNTQLRVSVRDRTGSNTVRFWGNVPTWPVGWDLSARDVQSPITAYGIRRRLTVGAIPLQSAYKRAELALSAVLGYWPMEDGSTATSFANALNGGAPAGFTVTNGTMELSSDDRFIASEPLPVMTGVVGLTAFVPAYTPAASGQQVRMLFHSEDTVDASQGVDVFINTSGAHYFLFEYVPFSNQGVLVMKNYATGATEATNGPFTMSRNPSVNPVRLSIELKQNGTGIDCNVVTLIPGETSGGSFGVVTIPSSTLGLITSVQVANNGAQVTTTVGHLTVENHITSIFDLADVLDGYAGETAAARWTRLTTEAGISAGVDAGTVHTLVGPQGESTLLELLDEAAYADGGISTESVGSLALIFRERSRLYSGGAGLRQLSYVKMSNVEVVDDDSLLQNDVTVTRTNGGSARAVATSGNLTPALVGTYAVEFDLNLYSDTQLADQAGWRLAVGTDDKPRFPLAEFDYVQQVSTSYQDTLVAMREGDAVHYALMPGFSGSNSPDFLTVVGWSEMITPTSWVFGINAIPGDVSYFTFILDDPVFGVLDTDRLGL